MVERELELWKRMRTSLRMTPALQGPDVLMARMIVLPSNFSEWQVSLYLGSSGEARLEAVLAKRSVYQSNHEEKQGTVALKENPEIGTPDYYQAPVERNVAEAIGRVWSQVIHRSQLPKPQPSGSTDRTTYIFSRWVQGEGEICGEIREPVAGSIPERLTLLGKDLREFARSDEMKRKDLMQSIQRDLDLTQSQLNQSNKE